MHRSDGQILFSATDLYRHLDCPHYTNLSLIELDCPIEKDEPDEEAKLIMAKGIEHEKRFLAQALRQYGSVPDMSAIGITDKDRLEATREAMSSKADVIYQPFLLDVPFMGYADFLIKSDIPSDLGDYSYEALDTKLSRHPKPYYIIQLCLYSEMLANLQGVMPEKLHVSLGDGRTESFLVKDFIYFFRHLKGKFIEHATLRPETYPEPCSYCGKCEFRTGCENRRFEDDHPYQVANIRASQIRRMASSGITTMAALATTGMEHIKGIRDDTLARLKRQAQLQTHKRTSGEDKYIILPQGDLNRGLYLLPELRDGDIFFDIEGDPLFPDGLEYLFGLVFAEGGEEQFLDIWSHDHHEEKLSFERLVKFFIERLAKYPNMHIYHYASYEETALKRLMSKYGTMETEVDHLLRQKVLVDLFRVVRQTLQTSEPSYSLKNLERFYMSGRRGEVKTATESIVFYENYLLTKDEKYLNEIRSYNLEDCRSLVFLRDWLLKLKSELGLKAAAGPPREILEERINPLQDTLRAFEEALTVDLPENEADYTPTQALDKLVFDLADFYRREAKPAWWRMFDRQGMTSEELVEDADCIGGLKQSDEFPPFHEKKSLVYSYTFPDQEYKIKAGDTVLQAMTLETAGIVFSLDEEQNLLQLKRGTAKGPLPPELDLIPPGPISTDALRESLWNFISAYIECKRAGPRKYGSALNILERRPPRIEGKASGTPLYNSETAAFADYLELIKGMQGTTLFIQGPPGTGKTHTASHLIVELVKAGFKIGVMANSHKVIHNLLSAVEKRAVEAKCQFTGVKKASWSSEETFFDGQFIKSVDKSEDVIASLGKIQLVAGTAWLFAAFKGSEALDYLFIDEAGQISMANFIAAATSSKNVVLVGDQMQLAQPIQGVHPGESGLSVLEYLLRGRHTIPIEEGVLLNMTYRMHPGISRFISDAVYDGRIKSLPGLEIQAILAGNGSPSAIPEAGISCHFLFHEGYVQRCDPEAEYIKHLYDQLLQMKYRDRQGQIHQIGQENILVVSPYNLQVNNLRRILGEEARVGTIDKFQGQEAEIVMISMSTSTPEEVPRGLDFLYSQNRLNVSLSRARAVSILVLSPKLLDVRCSGIEQMKLVNTLCWAKEYAFEVVIE